ncbi:hypothetical protein PTTG_31158 [Puccinia triticina 1-1 BBBD Race 1]|uniref:Uncharacterized protein n=1 Tax=Puccinia triticina (isolate 1-1 / race 1 (BBBD)) TaxID=630390 RepID=A0A180FWB8_PUCT1|nr:hypothetical protein PTTG_31158 [Puccinia triticina 1-1 BBBD Race 1]
MLGGLLAVVWTESVQTVLLLIGAVVITVTGFWKIGGWSALAHALATHPHPLARIAGSKVTWGTGNFLNMARGAKDPERFAVVFRFTWLSGFGHLVLVLRPDNRSTRACGER